MHVAIHEIGQNKGKPRVWLQGEMLASAGFAPQTRYEINHREGALVLVRDARGYRNVSGKPKHDREVPVIDLNSDKVLSAFAGLEHVKVIYRENEIEIVPVASELRARERRERAESRMQAGLPLIMGSVAHGAGVLDHAMHAGLKAEGVNCELGFANEIRHDLMDQSMRVNEVWTKNTIGLTAPLQEIAFDESVLRKLPQIDILCGGLPCSGASVAGLAKRKLAHPEAHPLVGHLVVGYLALIMRTNPAVVVLEQVPNYMTSASMDLIRNQLRDMQYEIHETIVDGGDWNCLEHRKRMVMVAVTKGMQFDFAMLQRPVKVARTVGEILEPIAADDPRWSVMAGLKAKAIRDKESGKSFAMQTFTADSDHVCTLTKGLSKNRSTDPKWIHPENPELLRVPTATEHARCKNVPEHLIEGLSETIAHEALGQSINYPPFVSVARLVAETFKSFRNVQVSPLSDLSDLPLFQLAA